MISRRSRLLWWIKQQGPSGERIQPKVDGIGGQLSLVSPVAFE